MSGLPASSSSQPRTQESGPPSPHFPPKEPFKPQRWSDPRYLGFQPPAPPQDNPDVLADPPSPPVPAERAGGGAAPGGVVNTNAAYCTVLRARLGPHSLLFAAEVDCADPAPGPAPDPARYVELKTTATPTVSAQHRAFR